MVLFFIFHLPKLSQGYRSCFWEMSPFVCEELHAGLSCSNTMQAANTAGPMGLILGQGATTGNKKSDV